MYCSLSCFLLLFSASYYLHSPSTASVARYRRSACIDTDMLRLAPAACCDIGLNFSTTCCIGPYHATDQCRKRLEACINAEGGHSEQLLWRCLPDIPVATHHNRFFSEPPMTTSTHNWLSVEPPEPPAFERTQQTLSHMKKFRISQVSVVTFFTWGGQVDYSLFSSEIDLT